jgi:hypothetical protein
MNEAATDVTAWVESVRRSGGARVDPARFHVIEALAQRVPGLQEPVKALVEAKLRKVVGDYTALLEARPPAPKISKRLAANAPVSPLAQLNEHLRGITGKRAAPQAPVLPGEPEDQHELASVRRFRQARERRRSLDQVEKAAARKPVNAGPLNSHALVLQSLSLMRELSPDYLRHFLVHMESLQWLDQVRERLSATVKHGKSASGEKKANRKK